MAIQFRRYSELDKSERQKTSYLKIKRLALRIEQNSYFSLSFDCFTNSELYFAIRYYDLEMDARNCFYKTENFHQPKREPVFALTDFLCSLYEQDRTTFQLILSLTLKEAWLTLKTYYGDIKEELNLLGYDFDGKILKSTSGHPIIEQKITSLIEDSLHKINPELLEMRNGAIESLLSNKPDKARHVASSSRAMIDTLLRDLVPEIEAKEGESEIKLRIEKLFGSSESTMLVVNNTVDLIQTLNKVQSKGSHSSIDNELAFFIFELTEKLVYFILIYKNK